MKIINFDKENSLVSQYMLELRDVSIQRDRMRFRHNLQRIGEIMAYEISRSLDYEEVPTATPLGTATCRTIKDQLVLGTILRAGMPFHNGFLSYFDYADNAFDGCYYFNYDMVTINVEDSSGSLIGIIALVFVLIGVIWYLIYRKKQKKIEKEIQKKIADREALEAVKGE